MGQVTLSGDPRIEISLRRSGRARRISLRVSGVDGKVTLTLPNGVPEREGLEFARSRRDWIAEALRRQPDHVTVAPGVVLPVAGRPCRSRSSPGAAPGSSPTESPCRRGALPGRRSWRR